MFLYQFIDLSILQSHTHTHTHTHTHACAHKYIRIYIYIYIYIIMACRQHGYPWLSLATPPCRSSLQASPHDYIPYTHRASVCWFKLVVLRLFGHMRGSIGEHPLWARLCFSSNFCLSGSSNFDSFRNGR